MTYTQIKQQLEALAAKTSGEPKLTPTDIFPVLSDMAENIITGQDSGYQPKNSTTGADVDLANLSATGEAHFSKFSGSYDDLTHKPTIPAEQVNSDWDATSGVEEILNKPTLGTAAATDATDYATAAQGVTADQAATDITTIEGLIPAAATTTNQLADKSFVNSSIQNMAAFPAFYDDTKGWFPTRAALTSATVAYDIEGNAIGTDDFQNNYCYVIADEGQGGATTRWAFAGDTIDTRYFSLVVNNTPFTAGQIAAINSGITDTQVAKIAANETAITNHTGNTSNPHGVTKAQVGLGSVDNTSDANKPVSTAQNTAISAKYTKPATGIPAADLEEGLRTNIRPQNLATLNPTEIVALSWFKGGNGIEYRVSLTLADLQAAGCPVPSGGVGITIGTLTYANSTTIILRFSKLNDGSTYTGTAAITDTAFVWSRGEGRTRGGTFEVDADKLQAFLEATPINLDGNVILNIKVGTTNTGNLTIPGFTGDGTLTINGTGNEQFANVVANFSNVQTMINNGKINRIRNGCKNTRMTGVTIEAAVANNMVEGMFGTMVLYNCIINKDAFPTAQIYNAGGSILQVYGANTVFPFTSMTNDGMVGIGSEVVVPNGLNINNRYGGFSVATGGRSFASFQPKIPDPDNSLDFSTLVTGQTLVTPGAGLTIDSRLYVDPTTDVVLPFTTATPENLTFEMRADGKVGVFNADGTARWLLKSEVGGVITPQTSNINGWTFGTVPAGVPAGVIVPPTEMLTGEYFGKKPVYQKLVIGNCVTAANTQGYFDLLSKMDTWLPGTGGTIQYGVSQISEVGQTIWSSLTTPTAYSRWRREGGGLLRVHHCANVDRVGSTNNQYKILVKYTKF